MIQADEMKRAETISEKTELEHQPLTSSENGHDYRKCVS